MKNAKTREPAGPRRLPILRFGTQSYFIDSRLRQFRTATPPLRPIEFIDFESERGRRLLKECVVLECLRCGQTAVVSQRLSDAECLRCGRLMSVPPY